MQAIESFVNYLKYEKRYSAHTLTSYSNDVNQVSVFLLNIYDISTIHDAKSVHLRSWIVSLLEKKISPRSISRKISTLKSYFKFAISQDWVIQNPMYKLSAPKTSSRLPEFVDEKDMLFLLENFVFPDGIEGQRDKLILEMFYATGMRLSELISLLDVNVNLDNAQIKVFGKGNKERIIPLPISIQSKIQAYQAYKKQDFPNVTTLFIDSQGLPLASHKIYTLVKNYLGQVTTLKKKSPHILRHTFATHLLNHGADINAIKELLGHSSLASTQVYTHNSFERLKKIYEQAHPRA